MFLPCSFFFSFSGGAFGLATIGEDFLFHHSIYWEGSLLFLFFRVPCFRGTFWSWACNSHELTLQGFTPRVPLAPCWEGASAVSSFLVELLGLRQATRIFIPTSHPITLHLLGPCCFLFSYFLFLFGRGLATTKSQPRVSPTLYWGGVCCFFLVGLSGLQNASQIT